MVSVGLDPCVGDGLLASHRLVYGCPRLGMGYGSTASPKRGWAMAPLLPIGGDGLWLHGFPRMGDGLCVG